MGSFKKLKSSDVITVPVIANKTWNFNYCPIPSTDPYISVYNGTNYTNSFDPYNEPITNTHYDRLTYKQINQLFYHQYSGSLNTASLASSIHYLSASSQHPSASFFNYNNDPAFISYFPTGANETIRVIQISPDAYGNKVLPYSFQMSSSNYNFYDDGKGNIYDNFSGPTPIFVGNIFYPEGTIVITSQTYQDAFVLPAVAYDDVYSIIRSDYPNPATFSFYPLINDDLRGNTLVNNSIKIFGGNASFFSTGSNNSVSLSFSGLGVGTYQTFYTFLTTGSYCAPLMSSTASITVNVTDPECEFEIGIYILPPSPTVTPTITPSITTSVTPTPTITRTPSITPSSSPPADCNCYTYQYELFSDGYVCYTECSSGDNICDLLTTGVYTSGCVRANTLGGNISIESSVLCGNWCVSPSITPTPTRTQTPSISVTPSITPSITISTTPSITPSITVSPSVIPEPSVEFSDPECIILYGSPIGGSYTNNCSGTVTVNGASAMFRAFAYLNQDGGNVNTSFDVVGGSSSNAERTPTSGNAYGPYITLTPGTYSYNLFISMFNGENSEGGIEWVQ